MKKKMILVIAFVAATAALYGQSLDKDVMLLEINKARSMKCKCGNETQKAAPALVWDDKLTEAAQKHANDMSSKNFFSHKGSDKSSVDERIEREGFEWQLVGENIADGYMSEAHVIEGWMDSPGHCKNMMNPGFSHVGVAVSSDGRYWVQVFATPLQTK